MANGTRGGEGSGVKILLGLTSPSFLTPSKPPCLALQCSPRSHTPQYPLWSYSPFVEIPDPV